MVTGFGGQMIIIVMILLFILQRVDILTTGIKVMFQNHFILNVAFAQHAITVMVIIQSVGMESQKEQIILLFQVILLKRRYNKFIDYPNIVIRWRALYWCNCKCLQKI
jgi:hypothetical protein